MSAEGSCEEIQERISNTLMVFRFRYAAVAIYSLASEVGMIYAVVL